MPRMQSTLPRTRGFTLLELLVAIGLFALFSGLAYGSLWNLLDTRDRLEAEREFWRELALSFAQIEDDLGMARERTTRNVFGNPQPAFRGQPVDIRALGESPLRLTRGGQFVLGEGARADLQRIDYRLQDRRLQRLAWPDLDQAPQTKPQERDLLDNVTDLSLRFYAPGAGWVNLWPTNPQQLNQLPAAVEMTLTIDGRGQFQRVFRVNG